MRDYLRVLRYAFRHRKLIPVILVLAVLVAILYQVQVATLLPVAQMVVSPRSLKALEEEPWVKDRPVVLDLVRRALAWLPNQETPEGRYRTFMLIAGLVIAVTFLRAVVRFLHDYLTGILSTRSLYELRNDLYGRVIHQDLTFFSEAGVAKTMTRFTVDMQQIDRGIRVLFGLITREPIKAILCLGMALWVDWKLALLSMLVGPLLGLAIYQFGRAIKKSTRRVLGHFSLLNNILQETFLGIPIVKAFSMERYEMERFRQRNERLKHNQIRVERADAAADPTMEFLATSAVTVVAVVAAARVVFGTMPWSFFLLLYGSLIAFYDPARKLSGVNNRVQQCIAAARRVFEAMDTQPEIVERPDAVVLPRLRRGIVFRDVHFRYGAEGPEALRGVTLEIPAGATVALVGHSGAGKTTLINLIPRFYDPTAGTVEIDGVDLRAVTLESLRRQVALVTQNVVLFEDTVANNIAYGHHDVARERIVEAAKAANAHDFIQDLPQGYETPIGERGENLSGGQRARLAIARAVLADPAILILDEATANLDSESEALIQEALRRLEVGRTTIVIAHRLSTVQHADRVVVLHQGRVESQGTHQELLETSTVYGGLYRTQFGMAARTAGAEEA